MFYDIFIELCAEKNKKPIDVSRDLDIKKSTISMWKKQNSIPNAVTLMQLAEYFNVTPAYLMGNKLAKEPMSMPRNDIKQKEKLALSEKDERDISKRLNQALADLENSQGSLMFDGEPLDDITKELLIASLRKDLELGKQIAKKKYTPKKYRKSDNSEGD